MIQNLIKCVCVCVCVCVRACTHMCIQASVWKLCTMLITCVRTCVIWSVEYYVWEMCFLINQTNNKINQTIMKCRPMQYRATKLPAHLNLHTITFLSFICVVVGVGGVLHTEFYFKTTYPNLTYLLLALFCKWLGWGAPLLAAVCFVTGNPVPFGVFCNSRQTTDGVNTDITTKPEQQAWELTFSNWNSCLWITHKLITSDGVA